LISNFFQTLSSLHLFIESTCCKHPSDYNRSAINLHLFKELFTSSSSLWLTPSAPI